jgi:DNA-binding GntR family transcriptional regulator
MARTAAAETLASHVYAEIRTGILQGVFEPGQRLKPTELRLQFGVSVGVIREALSRLAEQRLVRSEHNQGFYVSPLTEKDLLDLTDTRVQIECYALRQAIARGDQSWEARIVAAEYLLSVTPRRSPGDDGQLNDQWSVVHGEFHRALIVGCDMPVLLNICDSLFDASELYRRISAHIGTSRDVVAEHHALMEATIARDVDLALSRLEEHFRRTTSIVLTLLRNDQATRPASTGGPVAVRAARKPIREL